MPLTASPIKRINHVNLRVRDLSHSVAFYCDLFGFQDHPVDPPSERVRQCLASNCEQNNRFGVVLTEGFPTGMSLAGMDHISFEVSSIEDVYEMHRRATSRGARATQPRVYEGHWQVFIFDPDGYKLEVLTRQTEDEPPQTATGGRPNKEALRDPSAANEHGRAPPCDKKLSNHRSPAMRRICDSNDKHEPK